MSDGQECVSNAYTGKYRGKVLSTEDLTMSGKLLCEVPALPGMLLNWATPSVPYAGIEQGLFALPPEGSDVWIEFENGNPDNPIWSGGYWEEWLEPIAPELAPEAPELVNVLKSKFCSLVLNDTPAEGGVILSAVDPAVAVPVMLTMTSVGFSVIVGEVTLTMSAEEGITLTAGESVYTLTPAGAVTEAPEIAMTAEANVNITAATTTVEGGDTNVAGPLQVEGVTTLVEEASIGGQFTVAGDTTLLGETNATGAVTAEGEVNVAGAMTTEGEMNALGELSAEGDVNVLGAQQTEGNNATIGLIEGIVVPPGL